MYIPNNMYDKSQNKSLFSVFKSLNTSRMDPSRI